MSDTDRPLPGADQSPTERKGGLPSARHELPPANPAVASRDTGEGAKGKPQKSAKPTPVRAVAEAAPALPSPTEPDVDEARVEVDGVVWTVRVFGRSGSPGAGETPLLLLGFEGESPGSVRTVREALIVGRTLRDLSEDSLRSAFDGSIEAPPEAGRGDPQAAARPGRERSQTGARQSRSSRRGRS